MMKCVTALTMNLTLLRKCIILLYSEQQDNDGHCNGRSAKKNTPAELLIYTSELLSSIHYLLIGYLSYINGWC